MVMIKIYGGLPNKVLKRLSQKTGEPISLRLQMPQALHQQGMPHLGITHR